MLYLILPTGLVIWISSIWFKYQKKISKARALGPTLNQYTNPFGVCSGLQKYTRDFWKEAPTIFGEMKSSLFFFVTGQYTLVHTNDAKLFHEVCKGKQECFPKAVALYDVLRIFGENVVTTDGDIWKRHRRCASAAFSETNNRLVHDTSLSTVAAMFESWSKRKDDKGSTKVHILADATQLTLAIISSAAFGMKIQVFDSGKAGSSAVNGAVDLPASSSGKSKFKLTFTRYVARSLKAKLSVDIYDMSDSYADIQYLVGVRRLIRHLFSICCYRFNRIPYNQMYGASFAAHSPTCHPSEVGILPAHFQSARNRTSIRGVRSVPA
jgi:Cytochrome P450